jgi:hypothetical protein
MVLLESLSTEMSFITTRRIGNMVLAALLLRPTGNLVTFYELCMTEEKTLLDLPQGWNHTYLHLIPRKY